jgi:hypothetical protein
VSARPKAFTLLVLSAINGLALVVFISGSAAVHHKHLRMYSSIHMHG